MQKYTSELAHQKICTVSNMTLELYLILHHQPSNLRPLVPEMVSDSTMLHSNYRGAAGGRESVSL